jgi:hypothetical protein
VSGPAKARCADVEELLPELALGILGGRERAAALDHVGTCAACSAELEELSQAADSLLQVAPEAEPPPGFEVRVLERLGVPRPHRPRPPRARRLRLGTASMRVAAAAAAAAAAALGLGVAQLAGSRPAVPAAGVSTQQGAHVSVARLTGAAGGDVYAYLGPRPWLIMTVGDAHWSGEVACVVTLPDGRSRRVGSFWLSSGYGAWAAALPAGISHLRGAQVVAPDGAVLAAGRFGT